MNNIDFTLLSEIEKRLQWSKELEKELDALDATGFESEINSIRGKLKNLDKIPDIVKEITSLKEKIEKRDVEIKKKTRRLKELEMEFDSLDTKGFESEAKSIKSKLKDIKNVDEVDREILELKGKIEKARKLKEGRGRIVEKEHMNLAMIGHIDHGKSTLLGRLLMETGVIDPLVVEEYRKKAEAIGKVTFEYAWVMDTLKDERERGITIDVAHQRLDTDKYYYTIVDCPGHRDFVKNMITGISQADAVVLVVDAKDGIMAQTKEHVFLARTFGLTQIIVAINKMDRVNYDQKRYEELKKEFLELLKVVGYTEENMVFVPVSAYEGENITKQSDKMKWFDGPTFLKALDMMEVPEKPVDLPLRVPVQDVYSITGVGTVPVGRVETGRLKKGDSVIFNPPGRKGEVKSIEMHHEEIPEAIPGDNIGWNVRGISGNEIRRGDVCGHVDNPPTVADEFTAQIVVLQHPSAITVGYTPVFHCHTAQVASTITEILEKLDPRTGATIEENPDYIRAGDAAVIKVKPTRPLVIERVREIPQLGRLAIRDMGQTVAAGMVMDVKQK